MGRRVKCAPLALIIAAALVAAFSCDDGLIKAVDEHIELTDDTDPMPGDSGIIVVVDERAVEVESAWSQATDTYVESARLEYRVFYSEDAQITTKEQVLSAGTPANEWTVGLTEFTLSGLDQDSEYRVNVLVRDRAAIPNVAAYNAVVVQTIIDPDPPGVPNDELVISERTPYSFRVSWTAADDELDPPSSLTYQLFYALESESLASEAEILANGTEVNAPQNEITTLVIDGLDEATEYNVNVLVRDSAGNAAPYQMATDETLEDEPPTPGADGELSGSDTTPYSLTVSWSLATDDVDLPADLTYQLYRSDDDDIATADDALANGFPVGSPATAISSRAVTGLDEDTTYYFNVLVQDTAGKRAAYAMTSFDTDPDLPPVPGGAGALSDSDKTPYSLTVSWAAATDDVDPQASLTYQLYRSLDDNIATVADMLDYGTAVGSASTAITSREATGLAEDTTYYFNVLVQDTAGKQAAYQMAPFDTEPDQPPAPGGSGVLADSDNAAYSLTVSWSAATDDVDPPSSLTYQLYRSLDDNIATVTDMLANGTEVGSPGAPLTSREATGLTADTTYYFNVLVQDTAGKQAAYQMAPFDTLPDYPPTPGGNVEFSDVTTEGFTIGWDPATDDEDQDVLEYRVFYSESDNISTYALALTNGTAANSFTEDLESLAIGSLDEITTYYVNIFVRDTVNEPVPYGSESQRTARLDRIYWTTNTWQVNRDLLASPAGSENIHTAATGVYADIVIDPTAERIYWTDGSNGDILTVQMDGDGSVETVVNDMSFPYGIDISSDGSELYVSDYTDNAIYRIPSYFRDETITDDEVDTLYSSAGSAPLGVALSVGEDYLYFVRSGSDSVSRLNLSDLAVNQDFVNPSFFVEPQMVAVDSEHIYWTDLGANGTGGVDGQVGRVDLDSPWASVDHDSYLTSEGDAPQGIVVDTSSSGYLYWVDYDTQQLYRAAKSSAAAAASSFQFITVNFPLGIAIYAP
jgi:hypothetical protein